MNKSCRSRVLVLWALALALTACGGLRPGQSTPEPPTPTPSPTLAVMVTQGIVRDAITTLPLAGARLQSGSVTALSDVEGAFSVPTIGDADIEVSAPGHEPTRIGPRAGFPLVVDLVPDAATTFQIVYDYEKRHEFGREYDLLHPDVQALFAREEFVRYMEEYRPYEILEVSVGAVDMLTTGSVLGRSYADVAQVPVQATVRIGEQVTRRVWMAYASQSNGFWRWFRGPLTWPTPTPSVTPTSTATPQPTATRTALPTRTPSPTLASPTSYMPIPPGNKAIVIADAAGLYSGPGEEYAISWGVSRGTVLLVLDWLHWTAGQPWYHVQIVGSSLGGWARGRDVAILAATPTLIPTLIPTLMPTSTPIPIPTFSPTPMPVPDGRSIAFTSQRDGNHEVYSVKADGTELRNLTQNPAQDGDPSWSPNHDRLAFTSDRNGNNDIFVMNADGSAQFQLTMSTADQVHPAWSPNGAWIAYVSNEDGDWEIFLMSVNGTGAVQLTHNSVWDSYPSWSPDSRKLVFTSERDGNYELYVYDLGAFIETRLTDNVASDAFPAWSPLGGEIAFTSARDGPLEIYLLDLLSVPNRVTRLTYTAPADAANRYPSWSHDASWLTFTTWRDGNAEIYLMRRDGSGLRNLTNNSADDESAAW